MGTPRMLAWQRSEEVLGFLPSVQTAEEVKKQPGGTAMGPVISALLLSELKGLETGLQERSPHPLLRL